jgi:heterotetrameric sarcosine oxidase gamma subunit
MSGTLAFLQAAADVPARSPMHRLAAQAGARMERRDGWELAGDYGEQALERGLLARTVGFTDRSQLCKLELQGDVSALAGAELAPGTALLDEDGAWWCPLTPTRALVLAEPGDAPRLRAAALAHPGVGVTEVTSGLAALTLAGPLAGELLARFCAIDVRPASTPVAAFRPGSVARTPGYLLREREDELLIMVGWALGEYLWLVVADAAGQLGGGPVGTAALHAHREALDA